jgi:hypothetical protein
MFQKTDKQLECYCSNGCNQSNNKTGQQNKITVADVFFPCVIHTDEYFTEKQTHVSSDKIVDK